MPVHNWRGIDDGTFHHLHQAWITHVSERLNDGLLPPAFYALAEQHSGDIGPDVMTLEIDSTGSEERGGGIAVLAPPKTALKKTFDVLAYVNRQNSVVIRHNSDDRIVAVFEIVSRGNKTGRQNFNNFMEKVNACFKRGIHFSYVDVHFPTTFTPNGIHGAICRQRAEDPPESIPDKRLSAGSYEAGSIVNAYVNPFGVGETIPETALFLRHDFYVLLPLEETYLKAFASLPRHLRERIEKNV